MNYTTIKVRTQHPICFIQLYRPDANNTINHQLIEECTHALRSCDERIKVVVLEGLPDVFCFGADFQEMRNQAVSGLNTENDPEPLYQLWQTLATGPFITISHVRGKVNAGGVGFVAASDIVIADDQATFSLSELLFGLFPACVLPFLIRRMGYQKAHYMTLMTQPISVEKAHDWGLVDAYDSQSQSMLRKHLLRLKRMPKAGILRYKRYMNELDDVLQQSKAPALAANRAIFADATNLENIVRFVEQGQLPGENE
ncbi:enoyl-CoA hydratase/isomerase [Marininema halotolerans]|uniref:Polyketide biosynthesis enoyl-CoA hydratase PksH n=1 Tax=Marininema halotolerans TaxID=1155944 RepID=A0A1I6PQ46_9BACL|nr:enoyl-CoA hydratase/isomerase [Marininema halotolerans]SFS42343.1 polyketide biosynthesis enoyl-CoA hydratase PksH [Marininema halotolerans]